jgi:hypothetical protein
MVLSKGVFLPLRVSAFANRCIRISRPILSQQSKSRKGIPHAQAPTKDPPFLSFRQRR